MRVIPSEQALGDLADIDRFSVERFGSSVAQSYLAVFFDTFDQLGQFPEIGASMPPTEVGVRSIKCGSHRIFYRIVDDVVLVERVLHVARDWPKALR